MPAALPGACGVAGRRRARRAPASLRRLPAVLGGAARRAARREPRRRVAPDRGDDRRLRAARRLQRPPGSARGRLEVPRADDLRADDRAARDRRPVRRARRRRRDAPHARLERDHARAPARRHTGAVAACCCSPVWRRRSAGRRCTTGCPTRTARRRRRSARCSRPRCCRPSCSSPGGSGSRSRRATRRRRTTPSSGSGSCRSRWRCRSCGGRCRSSGCSPTRAWSTWACSRWGSASRAPLAIAGVVLHLAGHALAKALGFYATIPLLAADPRARGPRPAAVARTQPAAAARGRHLARTLAGLPPSPLFASELLILAGGFPAGQLGRPRAPPCCSRSASSASCTR